MVAGTVKKLGKMDYVVNSARIGMGKQVMETETIGWEARVGISLTELFCSVKEDLL